MVNGSSTLSGRAVQRQVCRRAPGRQREPAGKDSAREALTVGHPPGKKPPVEQSNELTHRSHRCQTHNVVKFRKGRIDYAIPQSHSRAKCEAIAELNDPSNVSRSIHEMLPSHSGRRTSEVDNILYSFDRSETPGKPLSLDVFVKTNPRETEKLVEKEYEILDGNGEPLRGRKARRDLRRKSPKPIAEEPGTIDDDGFELV